MCDRRKDGGEESVARTEREKKERSDDLVGAAENSRKLAELRRLQKKGLHTHRTCQNRKSGLRATKRTVDKDAKALFAKRKSNKALR